MRNLFGIEYMDMMLVTPKGAILPESVNQAITIDRGCLHSNGHFTKLELVHCRHNSL